jgi:uncharacterized protein (DUF885 family)
MKKTTLCIQRLQTTLLCFLLFSAPLSYASKAVRQQIDTLADEYVALIYRYAPEAKTFSGMPDAEHERLNDNRLTTQKHYYMEIDDLWQQVKTIRADDVKGTTQWVTYGFLHEALKSARARRICRMELWSVSHLGGWQVSYPGLAQAQPVDTDELRNMALQRWSGLAGRVDTEIANLKYGLKLGYSSPQLIVRRVVKQIDKLLDIPVAESPFAAPLKKNVPDHFRRDWKKLIKDDIYPALKRYRDFLQTDYLPRARTQVAITEHPNGQACYRASYRAHTTLSRSAQQVFDLGHNAVAANQNQLITLGQKAFRLKDPKAIRQRLKQDPENRFQTKEGIIKQAKDIVAHSREVSRQWFNLFPKKHVIVEAIPPYQEQAVTASYRRAPDDGSDSARYMINLYQPNEQLRGQGEITAIHETYPGHHLQIAIAQEQPASHRITKMLSNSGFTEGWARYAEGLAEEMGLYQSDYARIGRLSWPARGMVADAGIHGMGWSHQQAIDYMNAAGTLSSGSAENLLARIAVWPGQLAAYDTGGLEIMALRREAKTQLGDCFDIKAFHDQVLKNGAITLPMLREQIKHWIESLR